MTVLIGFDGTCVEKQYPRIGKERPGCVETLRELAGRGHTLVLDTFRQGDALQSALNWFKKRKIPISTNKQYHTISIDYRNLSCPCENGYTDWKWVRAELGARGLIDLSVEDCGKAMSDVLLRFLRANTNIELLFQNFELVMKEKKLDFWDASEVFEAAAKNLGSVWMQISASQGSRIVNSDPFIVSKNISWQRRRALVQVLEPFHAAAQANNLLEPGNFIDSIDKVYDQVLDDNTPAKEIFTGKDNIQIAVNAIPLGFIHKLDKDAEMIKSSSQAPSPR